MSLRCAIDGISVAAAPPSRLGLGSGCGNGPLVYAAAGRNEVGLWDVATGTCHQVRGGGRAWESSYFGQNETDGRLFVLILLITLIFLPLAGDPQPGPSGGRGLGAYHPHARGAAALGEREHELPL